MFITGEQCKKIIGGYLGHSGRGGFMTGTITAVAPLSVVTEGGFPIAADELYITDSCVGLALSLAHTHKHDDVEKEGAAAVEKDTRPALRDHVVLRRALAVGDGVLLLCRPDRLDGVKYILLDRIQPYSIAREVSAL